MLTSNLSNSRNDMVLYWISVPVSSPYDGLISLTHKCKFLFMVPQEPVLIFRKLLFILCVSYTTWKHNWNHSRNWVLPWFICYATKISVINNVFVICSLFRNAPQELWLPVVFLHWWSVEGKNSPHLPARAPQGPEASNHNNLLRVCGLSNSSQ